MLLRFVEPSSGDYYLGGVNARDISGDEIRRMVGLCAQDAHIFDSTIRENLRLARPDCDDNDLRDALRRVRLLDWVERLPDGLDTQVGEGGQRLSEGERRRISVARVLLADFPAIVFDEPTANLDQPIADALVRDLLAATADRATVLITHRLSALELVDEIIVLKNGSVAERGTHDQLVLAGGLYTDSLRSEHGPVGRLDDRSTVNPQTACTVSRSAAESTGMERVSGGSKAAANSLSRILRQPCTDHLSGADVTGSGPQSLSSQWESRLLTGDIH